MKKECIAMLLAGGQGSRLGVLTRDVAKPAIPFGGKYRIIDFPLSNCSNSGVDTVGVLTQYRPLKLNSYIGTGQPWDLDRKDGGVFVLPPYIKGKAGEWYSGTANAITQNMEFIEQYSPEYILILSGDHIYTMDYNKMLQFHKEHEAAATISVLEVTLDEARRFGIMNTHEDGRIYEFEEKPAEPKSTKASMGVYIFNWKLLRQYLIADEKNHKSHHDFGKNIIPAMLDDGLLLYAYDFEGYWKDVGTADSLWQSNMDLLGLNPKFDLSDGVDKVYARNLGEPAHYIADSAIVKDVIIGEGSQISGSAYHSIISTRATIGEGSVVRNSVLMPYVHIGKNCVIEKAMIAEGSRIEDNCTIGREDGNKLTVVGAKLTIPSGMVIEEGIEVDENKLDELISEYADGGEEIIC